MDSVPCTLCAKKCLPKEKTLSSDFNNPSGVNKDEDALNNELQVIFLLRKILEIPQEICCTFLTEYGDPCSWIDFCNSCLDLIQKGKVIFDQVTLLQKQFKTLQKQIKDQMIDIPMERKLDEGKRRVKERIRSYINLGISSVGNIVPNEDMIAERSSSEETPPESTYLLVAANNAKDVFVKTEIIESLVDPLNVMINQCDEFGHYFEEMNPVGLLENAISSVGNITPKEEIFNGLSFSRENATEFSAINIAGNTSAKTEPNESFPYPLNVMINEWDGLGDSEVKDPLGLLENGEDGVSSKELAKRLEPEYIEIKQIKLEQEFLPETSNVIFSTLSCEGDEPSQVGNSPTYIIPEKIEETNLNHLKKTNSKKFICEYCAGNFKNNSDLEVHKRSHTGEKPYKCKTCEQTFSKSNSLFIHQKRHTKGRPFKCSFCKKAFITLGELNRHIKRHNEETPYKCRFCEKFCVSTTELYIHERKHAVEKPFKCEVCGQVFGKSSSLVEHLRSHTGERPFKCTFCEKTFMTARGLQDHEKTHTGEKPYQCIFCEKSFGSSSEVTVHERIHTGERPFKCGICENTFISSSALGVHRLAVHATNVKPYKCDICVKYFATKSTLNFHKEHVHASAHTGDKPYISI